MKKIILGLVILVVAGGVAAYMYSNPGYKQMGAVSGDKEIPNLKAPNPADRTAPGAMPTAPSGLTADEKAALASFGPTTNKDTQLALAAKVAKETGSIEVTNCALNPAVLRIKAGQDFTLQNKSDVQSVVTFYVDNKPHSVAANGSTVIKASFGNGDGGLFGFYCRSGAATYSSAVLVY